MSGAMPRKSLAALAFLLASCATTHAEQAPAPEIALTIDDLPVHGPIPQGQTPSTVAKDIIAALSRAHVPAYGFINAKWVTAQPETLVALKDWRAAGLPLGNHTWAHRHLSEMSVAEFNDEVARDETVLAQLAGGTDWHWFRYPFLDEGENPEKRNAARQELAKRGYKIAAVTMDFDDWAWTAPYARCMAKDDRRAIARLEKMYLTAAREAIEYHRGLAHQLYGRDIPYVVLLHDSGFEARMLPRLIRLYRSAGFRFVSLFEAQRDPYYADQVGPDLPAEPEGLENKAVARGILLPKRTDFQTPLSATCPDSPTVSTP